MSDDSDDTFSINLRIRPGEGDMTMRTIVLGNSPMVLIELEDDEDGEPILSVDASCFDDKEELADLLGLVVHTLRDGDEVDS